MTARSHSLSDGEIPDENEEKVATARTTTISDRTTRVDPFARPKSSSRFPQHADSRRTWDPDTRSRNNDGVVDREQYNRGTNQYNLEHEGSRPSKRAYRVRSRSRSRSPWRPDRSFAGVKRKHSDLSKHSGDDLRSAKVVREYGPSAPRGGRGRSDFVEAGRVEGLTELGDFYSGRGRERRRPSPGSARSLERSRSPYYRRSRSRSPFYHGKLQRLESSRSGLPSNQARGSVNQPIAKPVNVTPPITSLDAATPPHSRGIHSQEQVQPSHALPPSQEPEPMETFASQTIEQDHQGAQTQHRLTEEEIIEQRRKRRQELRAKHATQPDLLVKALEQNIISRPATPADHTSPLTSNSPGTSRRGSTPNSPAAFEVDDFQDLANQHHKGKPNTIEDGPSAADYDPNMDMGEDRPNHKKFTISESQTVTISASEVEAQADKPIKPSDDFDMFAEEVDDDIFAAPDTASKQMMNIKEAKTLHQELHDAARLQTHPQPLKWMTSKISPTNITRASPTPSRTTVTISASEVEAQADKPIKPSDDFDMFAEEVDDDIFAAPDTASKQMMNIKEAKTLDQSLLDNWDYDDGHYRIILNELLDGRYAVQEQIGKGTFATVVRAMDTKTGLAVAIKIACNNDTMYKAGQREMEIVQRLNADDVNDKKHIIRLHRSFIHKAHLCLVFESMNADLRVALKRFGRDVGINLKATRSYAQQIFLALAHMKKSQIIHGDLKPDNILISDKLNVLKICDLGTATTVDKAEITPYLVSRFYRAPEVILGMKIGHPIDMWSIGCTLFELYTGRILFPGNNNNQMLRIIQECRGKIPNRILKVAPLLELHFGQDLIFVSRERDKITDKVSTHRMPNMKSAAAPGKDLKTKLGGCVDETSSLDMKAHEAFVDLLDKCLQSDPVRRITPEDALNHPFIAHQTIPAPTPKAKVVPAMGVSRKR
nr:serine/threonine-protein kinase prp4 [Quercus suber]